MPWIRCPRPPTRPACERERGLGIPLVRGMADDVQFLVKDDGTTVRVVLFHSRATALTRPRGEIPQTG